MAETFCRVVDAINMRAGSIFSLLILAITAITINEVISRYAFNHPWIWSWDINIQLASAFAVFAGGYTLLTKGHVMVDIVVLRASPRTRAIIDLITAVLFLGICVLLIWKGGEAGWRSFVTREAYTSMWEPPIYILKMAIPVAVFLLFLQGIAKFIRDLKIAMGRPPEVQQVVPPKLEVPE